MLLEQYRELRSIVGEGEPPTDADLLEAFERLGSVTAVALEVQRSRLATLRSQPASVTVDGDFSENWGDTIKSLERHVAELQTAVVTEAEPTAGMVTVSRFSRAGRSR